MPSTPAKILSAVANAQAARTPAIVESTGMSKATVLKHLRALSNKGFIFCEDDYEGRNRRQGRYSNALWVIQGETSGFTPEQAQKALNAVTDDSFGRDILFSLDLCC